MPDEEAIRALMGDKECSHYALELQKSQQFRKEYSKRNWVISAEEMPWENSPQGRLKHVVNEYMDTMECCVDAYQQLLAPGGRSGRHRHMAEEVFIVLEGKGYDLHWDPIFDVHHEYIWSWNEVPKRFAWEEGDYVFIPPYTMHQHFNADSDRIARFITATNRIVNAMGFNWKEQVENAPEYKP